MVIVAARNFAQIHASRDRKAKTGWRDARALCDACQLGKCRDDGGHVRHSAGRREFIETPACRPRRKLRQKRLKWSVCAAPLPELRQARTRAIGASRTSISIRVHSSTATGGSVSLACAAITSSGVPMMAS